MKVYIGEDYIPGYYNLTPESILNNKIMYNIAVSDVEEFIVDSIELSSDRHLVHLRLILEKSKEVIIRPDNINKKDIKLAVLLSKFADPKTKRQLM